MINTSLYAVRSACSPTDEFLLKFMFISIIIIINEKINVAFSQKNYKDT